MNIIEGGSQGSPSELHSFTKTTSLKEGGILFSIQHNLKQFLKQFRSSQRWQHIGRKTAILLTFAATSVGGTPAKAEPLGDGDGPGCKTEEGYQLGFKLLAGLIPCKAGKPLEAEHFEQSTGNSLQQTTKGLMVWRKKDNWTAFTDGVDTYINGPDGLAVRSNSERFGWEETDQVKQAVADQGGNSSEMEVVPVNYLPEIIGSPEYVKKIKEALAFFKENDPELYATLINPAHVQIIKQIPNGAFSGPWGVIKNNKVIDPRPHIEIGDDRINAITLLCAGSIAHEATHNKQYHEQIAPSATINIPHQDPVAAEIQPIKASKKLAESAAKKGYSPDIIRQVIDHYNSLIIKYGGDPNTPLDFSASILATGK